jgi:membrane-associated phospholipid phosphatase
VGRAPLLTRDNVERAALTAGVAAFFVTGYFGIGRTIDPARARDLATALDRRIPFVASAVWVYLAMFPAALSPLLVVRCPRLFRRTVAAYGVAIAASLIVFAALPVTSAGLRADSARLDTGALSPRVVSLLYGLDPPFNSFPSLHLSIATLAALSAWKAGKLNGWAAAAGVFAIGVSVVAVKQHFVLDAAGGLILAALIYAVVVLPYEPTSGLDGISPSRSRNAIR